VARFKPKEQGDAAPHAQATNDQRTDEKNYSIQSRAVEHRLKYVEYGYRYKGWYHPLFKP
jgi:hypothetical protein